MNPILNLQSTGGVAPAASQPWSTWSTEKGCATWSTWSANCR